MRPCLSSPHWHGVLNQHLQLKRSWSIWTQWTQWKCSTHWAHYLDIMTSYYVPWIYSSPHPLHSVSSISPAQQTWLLMPCHKVYLKSLKTVILDWYSICFGPHNVCWGLICNNSFTRSVQTTYSLCLDQQVFPSQMCPCPWTFHWTFYHSHIYLRSPIVPLFLQAP